jgi:CDP-paratose 2-epimerase
MQNIPNATVIGIDNLSRDGSWINIERLKKLGVSVTHSDVRIMTDLETIEEVECIIDAAATPSVIAGVVGGVSSRKLMDQNLLGTINLLELCRKWRSCFVFISSSRVYSITALQQIPLLRQTNAFQIDTEGAKKSLSYIYGIPETFSTETPISLYGASKLASELVALEYGDTFGFPVFINRCGVLAGAGQFGKADQGIFSYWLHGWFENLPLKYIGFGGQGLQVRDMLHPNDLAELILRQAHSADRELKTRIFNVSGGACSATSLKQLSNWCSERWGKRLISSDYQSRIFDVPWIVLDSKLCMDTWGWKPRLSNYQILDQIGDFA